MRTIKSAMSFLHLLYSDCIGRKASPFQMDELNGEKTVTRIRIGAKFHDACYLHLCEDTASQVDSNVITMFNNSDVISMGSNAIRNGSSERDTDNNFNSILIFI